MCHKYKFFVIQFLRFTNPSSFQGFCEYSLLFARILYITSSVDGHVVLKLPQDIILQSTLLGLSVVT